MIDIYGNKSEIEEVEAQNIPYYHHKEIIISKN